MADRDDVYEQVENPTMEWEVKSSTFDSSYKILTDGKIWSCTCLGYFYRGDCKHIRQIKEDTEK